MCVYESRSPDLEKRKKSRKRRTCCTVELPDIFTEEVLHWAELLYFHWCTKTQTCFFICMWFFFCFLFFFQGAVETQQPWSNNSELICEAVVWK